MHPPATVRDDISLLPPTSSPPSMHRGMGSRNKSLSELSSLGGGTHGHHPYRDIRGEYHSHHGALLHDRDREVMNLNEAKETRHMSSDVREGRIRSRDSSRAPSPTGHAHHGTAPYGYIHCFPFVIITNTPHSPQHHSHLAHSVRVAFGMTPIHLSPAGSSHSHASTTTPASASIIGKLSLHPTHSTHTSPLPSPLLRPGSPGGD
ncbi:hypothetical protein BDP27DRAFT_358968 [Rhodocollybia butyracea]|uniref:Uncharacterized protein n=1 Tax=Rhodocollybia butyracea TaxID=206335 RepID=A0A9P5PDI8_9AGAR|nr:hypothetical protein BDP27DRAFT_358968 [Rhodocollybia butyracea]